MAYNPRARGGSWPWDEMELMLEHMFSPRGSRARPEWRPQVDVLETEREYIILSDVPGMEADEVEVALRGTTLTIRGERRSTAQPPGAIRRVQERPQGRFERRIQLPAQVQAGTVDARCNNGVLTIRVPKPHH